jgi:penicillin-binding protein 1C
VKTGTSQAYRDNWTIGYSKHVTVGVWVGNFDRTPLRNSSGVTGAAPIFHGVMLAAERRAAGGTGEFGTASILSPGSDSTRREICALSGLAANNWCPNRRHEWAAIEAPPVPCSWHHLGDEGLLTILPAEYQGWEANRGSAVRRADARGADRPSDVRRVNAPPAAGPAAALQITSPADGSTYLIDPTLRREYQTLSLKVIAATGRVVWAVDGRSLGASLPGQPLDWPLTIGRHRFTVRDASGRTAQSSITVK